MSLIVTVTNAGYAALAAAQAGGTGPLLIAKVGVSPTAITPLPTMTALAGETKRITTISGLATDPKTVHLTVKDETFDAYTVKSFALYLSDDTLFAIYGQPDAIIIKTASSVVNLAIDVTFAAVASADLTFGDTNFVNPDATEVTKGVMALATNAEASAGTVPNKAITPKTLAFTLAAWLAAQFSNVWRSTNDGAGSGLDADLLDGQQGAWYSDIAGRLGFTPANKAGDTFTGAIKRDANFYMDLSGGNPYLPFDAGDYLLYDRVNNRLNVYIGAARVGWFDAAGNFNVTGDVVADGNVVWHTGNDGTGSGLDAGLLGGQLPAFYTAITARLGYTPLNQTAYTAADVLAKLVTVDGTGSGLDAGLFAGQLAAYYTNIPARLGYTPWHPGNDGAGSGLDAGLLGGQLPAYYTAISARLGYTPANRAGDTVGSMRFGDDAYEARLSGANPRLSYDTDDYWFYSRATNTLSFLIGNTPAFALTSGGATVAGGTVWHTGNDGSGSGLDADTVDGLQGAALVKYADYESSFVETSGYRVSPDGYIENWAKVNCVWNSTAPFNWAKAFPARVLNVQVTAVNSNGNIDNGGAVVSYSVNGAVVARTAPSNDQTETGYLFVYATGI